MAGDVARGHHVEELVHSFFHLRDRSRPETGRGRRALDRLDRRPVLPIRDVTELPRVTEIEWPRIRCEIIVERESQKGMVLGRRGSLLKQVGEAVRHQLREGAFIELFVRVDPEWQHKPAAVRRLGY